jgi:hypothetical protein
MSLSFATKSIIGLTAFGVLALFVGGASAAEEKLAPAPIKIPKPAYVGTPKNVPPGVVKPSGKPRPDVMWPEGAVNLALKKTVTSSDKEPIIGNVAQVTDGDKEATEGSYVELGPGVQWVQIDLGASHAIYGLAMWHDFGAMRYCRGVIVQISDDPTFKSNVTTLYNNDIEGKVTDAHAGIGKDKEYLEHYAGKVIQAAGQRARYVRLYSNGSNDSDNNHYVEVEVYGVK